MRITPEILQAQWDSIKFKDGGFLQIDTEHPLEWHIGYQSVSQKTLLLVSGAEIGTVESSKSMSVFRRRRDDNRWSLTFELLKNEQQGVFAIFCCDMIEYSRPAPNEKDALKLVISRYQQWSKLLEFQKSGLMDEPKRKGLLGELLFLEQQLDKMSYFLAAVQGWVGADSADQDFMYPDSWHEIKSIVISATSVSISSIQQLDCLEEGELVVMRIDKVSPDKVGAVSLNGVVQRLKSKLSADDAALDLFQAKLTSYGYIDLQEYAEQKYYHSGTQKYRVDNTFPRLIAETLPHQITAAHYELNLPSLESWLKG
ncbi:MAG: PD-(D/E)XK motif protein [Desulfarculales bacterium]|jgi:hypothetical protein|nr:PD-(D/E)XK motif protein [Desulfarculales bacterium]